MASMLFRPISIALLLLCLFIDCMHAVPLRPSGLTSQQKAKRSWSAGSDWAPQSPPMLLPYASGAGFVSPFPSGLSDRWAGYLADAQFAGSGSASKRTAEEHFMEPAGWLGLGEPGRFEWNFNRLR